MNKIIPFLTFIVLGNNISAAEAAETKATKGSEISKDSKAVLTPRLMSPPEIIIGVKQLPKKTPIGHVTNTQPAQKSHRPVGDFYAGSRKGKWLDKQTTGNELPIPPENKLAPSGKVRGQLLQKQH